MRASVLAASSVTEWLWDSAVTRLPPAARSLPIKSFVVRSSSSATRAWISAARSTEILTALLFWTIATAGGGGTSKPKSFATSLAKARKRID